MSDLSEASRHWRPRALLASMATDGPVLTIPIGSRPAGDTVVRIEINGDIDYDNGEATEEKIKASTGATLDVQIDSEEEVQLMWGDSGCVYLFECATHPEKVELLLQCF